MKNGPQIPNWAVGVIIGVVVIAAAAFGFKAMQGEQPLDKSHYPKEAFQPPKYTPPAGVYTKDGKPVTGP